MSTSLSERGEMEQGLKIVSLSQFSIGRRPRAARSWSSMVKIAMQARANSAVEQCSALKLLAHRSLERCSRFWTACGLPIHALPR